MLVTPVDMQGRRGQSISLLDDGNLSDTGLKQARQIQVDMHQYSRWIPTHLRNSSRRGGSRSICIDIRDGYQLACSLALSDIGNLRNSSRRGGSRSICIDIRDGYHQLACSLALSDIVNLRNSSRRSGSRSICIDIRDGYQLACLFACLVC